ncbi:hypothetical protein ZWY2020_028419, partial [Hordeum vulgare]
GSPPLPLAKSSPPQPPPPIHTGRIRRAPAPRCARTSSSRSAPPSPPARFSAPVLHLPLATPYPWLGFRAGLRRCISSGPMISESGGGTWWSSDGQQLRRRTGAGRPVELAGGVGGASDRARGGAGLGKPVARARSDPGPGKAGSGLGQALAAGKEGEVELGSG